MIGLCASRKSKMRETSSMWTRSWAMRVRTQEREKYGRDEALEARQPRARQSLNIIIPKRSLGDCDVLTSLPLETGRDLPERGCA